MVGLAAKREATKHVVVALGLTERRACKLVAIERSTFRRRLNRAEPAGLRARLKELAEYRRRYGYRRLHVLLKREGFNVNKKLVYRIYKNEKLSLKIRKRKRLASVVRIPAATPAGPNERWSMDFVSDQLGHNDTAFLKSNAESIECLVEDNGDSLSVLVKTYEVGDAFDDYLVEILGIEPSWVKHEDNGNWIFRFEDMPEDSLNLIRNAYRSSERVV